MTKPEAKSGLRWRDQPEDHDYPAAASYLSLIKTDAEVDALVAQLRSAPVVTYLAKDIFRASGLSLLGVSNTHVERDQAKIDAGQALSPLLLVRDGEGRRVVIADGYHRLCAVYTVDEDAAIPCKIV